MPNKYYVMLYRNANNLMTFPIKAPTNQYNGQSQFAGGYPALFGGTDEGGLAATLVKELDEESRGTLEFDHDASVYPYFTGRNNYFFYWTPDWGITGRPWGSPQNRDEGEMLTITSVSVNEFTAADPPSEVLRKLIYFSGAPGGTQQQYQEFVNSETAAAFVQFVYDSVPYVPGELPAEKAAAAVKVRRQPSEAASKASA